MEKEYIPFGKEWEKEMNKAPKRILIAMLKKQCQMDIKQMEALKKVQLQVGQIEHNWDYREKTYMPFVVEAIKENI